jgi:hypothetical protein
MSAVFSTVAATAAPENRAAVGSTSEYQAFEQAFIVLLSVGA